MIKHFPDIGFTVLADNEKSDYSVTYIIYYYNNGLEDTNVLTKCCDGWVKWDGCSNWYLSDDDCTGDNGGYIHCCTEEEIFNIGNVGAVLVECLKMTQELCSNWSPC